ncbi:hypothetical protein DHC50_14790 [Arenibacter sp. A80]|jgi:hypothetical protein|nr:hypothetical protein [Arenibacter sp. A80]RFT55282.1 hypothetical protein D0S24_14785 [Arenibacter sp. P308M17]|tara:strand:- start:1371 stop:1604 length:234 start_codon:yes stop_codon:yes gene_type:complete
MMALNCVEQRFREKVGENFDGSVDTAGKVVKIRQPKNSKGGNIACSETDAFGVARPGRNLAVVHLTCLLPNVPQICR